MASLILLQNGQATPYPLSGPQAVMGRHPECEIHLESNMVSRRHAQIVKQDQHFVIEDLGSGNGTFLNGQRLVPRQATPLSHSDRIKLGPILLRFETENASADTDGTTADRATIDPNRNPTTANLASTPAGVAAMLDSAGSPNETVQATGSQFVIDENDSVQSIMGSAKSEGGFGLLSVQPEKKLRGVIGLTLSLAGAVEPKEVLPKILETLFDIFPHADRGSILLEDPDKKMMYPAVQKHRRDSEDATVKLSRTVLRKVQEEKQGILSADAATDEQFQGSESIANLSIRSMMCAPLLSLDQEVIGIINIDTQNALQQFNEEDLDLLLAIAGQASVALENARLMQTYLEKIKQDNELGIARNVQEALLPEKLPEQPGWQFFASYDAAQAVGGDYYDAFMLDDNKICLSFGDVAGKGVPGALIMSRIASCVQNVVPFVNDVEQAIHAINRHMCSSMVEGRFVTYVLAIIDLTTNEMTLTNAGHMSPLIRKVDGSIDYFPDETVGIPIGIMEDYPYEVVHRKIEPGELVVIITDGVDEAMNPAGDLYTKERVLEFVAQDFPNAADLGKALLTDVRRHAAGRDQNDDITIMTFGREPV